MFLIEILLGIAILSAVVLVVAVFYSSSTRALTGFRARRDAIGYAQAELSHWQALARLGAVDPASGLPVARGYASIVADGLEHGVDEYRAVTVTLRDSRIPPRFSPVTMTTNIRRPDPAALDLRDVVDLVSLRVQLLDTAGAPIVGACGPQVLISTRASACKDLGTASTTYVDGSIATPPSQPVLLQAAIMAPAGGFGAQSFDNFAVYPGLLGTVAHTGSFMRAYALPTLSADLTRGWQLSTQYDKDLKQAKAPPYFPANGRYQLREPQNVKVVDLYRVL